MRGSDLTAQCAMTGLLLCCMLFAVNARANEHELSPRALYRQVHRSVVTVQSWEGLLTLQNHLSVHPLSEQGSGVLISAQGEVLTAAHLVQTADTVRVKFIDGTTLGASVVASEPAADVALLKLEQVPDGVPVAKLADSDQAQVGDRVIVIGAPYGLSHTMTIGYLSARHAPGSLGGKLVLGEFLQTDAAINRGNSGGPMFNANGEVIGIVSYILSRSGAFEGLGFGVAINTAREFLLERRSFWSGISVFGLTGTLAKVLNLPQDGGAIVQRVAKDSLGARLGLLPSVVPARIGAYELLLGGDIILAVNGIAIVGMPDDYNRIREHLDQLERGEEITVKVLRHGRVLTLSVLVWE